MQPVTQKFYVNSTKITSIKAIKCTVVANHPVLGLVIKWPVFGKKAASLHIVKPMWI